MNKWIKKGDKVVVIAGNDRGRTGVILRRTESHVVIQGMNIRKKHAKRQKEVQTPTIIEMEMPIHISNVCHCDDEGQAVRVRARRSNQGKELFYKKDDKEIVLRALKKG